MTQKQQLREKRKDTRIETIEKQYGVDFGMRSNMKLGTFLERKGYPSLSKVIIDIDNKKNR